MLSTMNFRNPHRIVLSISRAGHGPRSLSSLCRPLQWASRPSIRTCMIPLGSGPRAPLSSVRQFSSGASSTEKSSMRFIWGLVGTNIGVFLLWRYKLLEATQSGVQEGWWTPAQYSLYQNLSMGLHDLRDGKPWTYITANFFHMDFPHIFTNMVTFFFMARLLAQTPGITTRHLAGLCLGGMVASDVGALVNFVATDRPLTRCHGFSGIGAAFMVSAACVHPMTMFYIAGIVPIPAWGIAVGYLAYSSYYQTDTTGKTAHGAHLGGAIFGALYYLTVLRKPRVDSASKIIRMLRKRNTRNL